MKPLRRLCQLAQPRAVFNHPILRSPRRYLPRNRHAIDGFIQVRPRKSTPVAPTRTWEAPLRVVPGPFHTLRSWTGAAPSRNDPIECEFSWQRRERWPAPD